MPHIIFTDPNDYIYTCAMVVTVSEIGYCMVLYPRHYNHDLGIEHKQHQPLPRTATKEIIDDLTKGVPLPRLAQNVKNELTNTPREHCKVKHFSSYDKLYYIQSTQVHQDYRKDNDDTLSVKKWILEHPNDIIYHKLQGNIDVNYQVSYLYYFFILL